MKIAFVFPGQGSQSVGMMAGFDAHPAVRATFDEASDLLAQDLWALVTSGPEADLNQTVNTQPVMLTAGVAVWRAWQAAGGRAPVVVAGHSLGEYTALVAAGALAFRDALPLVRFRAQAMQEAVPAGVGAMAAILGLDAATVAAVCTEASGAPTSGRIVEPVNFNGPEQIVIAGHRDAVERAIEIATAKGAKRGVLLPVSAPFHSSLLKPAAERLAARLRRRADRDAGHPRAAQRRRRGKADGRGDPRRARAAGGEPGALGRDHPGVRRARCHARRRMRAGPGAGRTQQAHRPRPQIVRADRRRRHRRDQGGARGLTRCRWERPWRMASWTDRSRW